MAGDSPKLSSSSEEERAARRAFRLQQVEMMERTAMGLGLESQDSMKMGDCYLQMEKLNQQNQQILSTLRPKDRPKRTSLNKFMGVLRRNDSDSSLEQDNAA